MSAAITIELPDLPEPFGEFYSDDRCDTLPDVYTADQMHAYAAEALRQSQSLPAGAVADLGLLLGQMLGQLSDNRAAFDWKIVSDYYYRLDAIFKSLQALQADAREKGEASVVSRNRPAQEPGGVECMTCGCIFIGEEWHTVCGVCFAESKTATQPAQASEKE